MLVTMLICVFSNIVSRYLFSVSFAWIEEVARFLMIWIVFLGAGLALRHGLHVAVMLLPDAVPALSRPLAVLSWIITFAFFGVLCWYGYEYAEFAARQRSTMLNISMYWVYLAVPIGAALGMLHMALGLQNLPLWCQPDPIRQAQTPSNGVS
jgi:TRAP-type C4-dicarboxylate transport system permease small subunit